MKIRKPKSSLSEWNTNENGHNFSKNYPVTTITPIFGGGVNAGFIDKAMPIRASAIRGQLRYWWRFLKENEPDENKRLEGKQLYQAEREIWGGLNNDGEPNEDKDYDAAGKVNVAVELKKKAGSVASKTFIANNGPGIKYALFSVENDLLSEGVEFTLKLQAGKISATHNKERNRRCLSDEQWQSVIAAVRWWANFGGIGARTRRGLGAVSVENVNALTHEEVERFGCVLKTIGRTDKALRAWNDAMTKLFQFRQGPGIGRQKGNGNHPGRSYWPEADTIRDITGKHGHPVRHKAIRSFPRAMFGLPIIYEIRGSGEPPKSQLIPHGQGSSRMASPLIIKPVADGRNSYLSTALCLPTSHLNDLEVQLQRIGGDGDNDFGTYLRGEEPQWWPTDVAEMQNKANTINPMQDRSYDPLKAFLTFFTERRA